MDTKSIKPSAETGDWAWLPARMPRVADMIRRKRAEVGPEHLNECWRRGVVEREPRWFFAWEAGLGVGTPWPEMLQALDDCDPAGGFKDRALCAIRPREASRGA